MCSLQIKVGFTRFPMPGQSVLQTPALLTQTPYDCPGPSGLRASETPSATPVNAILIAQQQNIPRARLCRLSATIVKEYKAIYSNKLFRFYLDKGAQLMAALRSPSC